MRRFRIVHALARRLWVIPSLGVLTGIVLSLVTVAIDRRNETGARRAGSVEEASEGARRAMEIGRANGDDDLEVFALSLIGRSEISGGAFDDGNGTSRTMCGSLSYRGIDARSARALRRAGRSDGASSRQVKVQMTSTAPAIFFR